MKIFLKRDILLNIILFAIVFDSLISFYLYLSELENQSLVFFENTDCEKLLNNVYSKIYNLSISVLGFIYFLFLFLITLISFVNDDFLSIGIIFSFIGFIFSLYLIHLQIYTVNSSCPYGIGVNVINILIFILYLLTNFITIKKNKK